MRILIFINLRFLHLQPTNFGFFVMHNTCRILFLFTMLSCMCVSAISQIIEKAAPSPVSLVIGPLDSVKPVVVISNISLSGNNKTKPYILQREIPFFQGDTIATTHLREKLSLCKQRLMNTALFVDVDVRPVVIDSSHLSIDINVKERWYLFPLPYFQIVTRNFNTWWVQENHRLDRVNYGLKFMQNNVTGRNDNLNVWIIAGYTQQLSLRYDNPSIDKKLQHGFNVGFGYSRNRELNYAIDYNKQSFYKNDEKFIIRQSFADLAYTYRPAIKTRHTVKVSYHNISVSDSIITKNPRFFSAPINQISYGDISYNLNYINFDYNPYPLKGFAGDVNLYKRFGKHSNIWQLGGSANYVKKLFPTTYVQFQGAGLLRFPTKQPYISNSLMGSASLYMRGLEYYVVEGSAGGVARSTFKSRVLVF